MGITSREFTSKATAIGHIDHFEAEFHCYDGGWIINGPGPDEMFRVYQGCVKFEDFGSVLSSSGCTFLYRHGEFVDWED